jgi:ring-1,2-phenylacetyl-CoA epoxidase subunit PaaD
MVGERLSEEMVWSLLHEVNDPEIPGLSIVDLKIVRGVHLEEGCVTVEITPTFVGCPALDLIEESIREKLTAKGCGTVTVKRNFAAVWSSDLLEQSARDVLERAGIAPPDRSGEVVIELPTSCPYCKSGDTQLESAFGATLCKQLYYCNSCRQSFEKFRSL